MFYQDTFKEANQKLKMYVDGDVDTTDIESEEALGRGARK
jgi:hypothetical protein